MSDLSHEIVLRPRFEISLSLSLDKAQAIFKDRTGDPITVKQLDAHVYIRFKKEHTSFWSPQLHLELRSYEDHITLAQGVFGPNPTLWTFFMFLHFGVGTLFLVLGVFTYSKHSLGQPITPLVVGMCFLVVIWVLLYVFGRLGKAKGKGQMEQLRNYVDIVLEPYIA